jgi:putative molybdopterin biosynthesis protein
MDGIALERASRSAPRRRRPFFLKKDQFAVVDTGDPLPPGADAVVMVEDVIEEGDGVLLYQSATPWQHIRQIGEDVCAGELLLPSFTEISPSAIGALLAGGVREVTVVKNPVVGIIPTGDEVVPPAADPREGEIPEFNASIFAAMLRRWGAEPVVFPIVRDELSLIKDAVSQALDTCDIVLLNAGSSAGREDYSAEAIREVGSVCTTVWPSSPASRPYSDIGGISRSSAFPDIPSPVSSS